MRFLASTSITRLPDPHTGKIASITDRLRAVVDSAVRAEELGFDGFGVHEQHERSSVSSSPSVVLSYIAARTAAIRLFATIAPLSLLDPVRAFEEYSTLDHLSGGRLELVIGDGSGAAQAELFRKLWRGATVTSTGNFGPAARAAAGWPRPLQQPIRIWHGAATSTDPADPAQPADPTEAAEPADLAALRGDPLFVANLTRPAGPYAELVRHYRDRWEFYGRDPATALIGAGTAGYYGARTSQQATETYRAVYNARQVRLRGLGRQPAFCSLEDAIERSSILVGSPQQIIDKVHRYHERLGHEVMHLNAEADGLPSARHQESLELFFGEIAPVLRRELPSRPFPHAAAAPASAERIPVPVPV